MKYTKEGIALARPYHNKISPDLYEVAAIVNRQEIGKLHNAAANIDYLSRSPYKPRRAYQAGLSFELWLADTAGEALAYDIIEALKALNLGKIE